MSVSVKAVLAKERKNGLAARMAPASSPVLLSKSRLQNTYTPMIVSAPTKQLTNRAVSKSSVCSRLYTTATTAMGRRVWLGSESDPRSQPPGAR